MTHQPPQQTQSSGNGFKMAAYGLSFVLVIAAVLVSTAQYLSSTAVAQTSPNLQPSNPEQSGQQMTAMLTTLIQELRKDPNAPPSHPPAFLTKSDNGALTAAKAMATSAVAMEYEGDLDVARAILAASEESPDVFTPKLQNGMQRLMAGIQANRGNTAENTLRSVANIRTSQVRIERDLARTGMHEAYRGIVAAAAVQATDAGLVALHTAFSTHDQNIATRAAAVDKALSRKASKKALARTQALAVIANDKHGPCTTATVPGLYPGTTTPVRRCEVKASVDHYPDSFMSGYTNPIPLPHSIATPAQGTPTGAFSGRLNR